jgi:hypothetical protein
LLLGLDRMGNAQTIVADLERARHQLLLRLEALDDGLNDLAYRAVVENSWIAKTKLRERQDEAERIIDEITLHDWALAEARRRALVRSADEVMAEIFGSKE